MLFHVTADTRWSDLPLSGSFVDMLKRIVNLSGSAAAETTAATGETREVVPPSRVLDGFGAFRAPPATARPVPARYSGRGTADHPPGFYGPPEGLVAVNTLTPTDRIAPDRLRAARRAAPSPIGSASRRICAGCCSSPGLALLLIDALVVFWLAGGLARLMRPRRPADGRTGCWPLPSGSRSARSRAFAQDEPAIRSALETKLAYVITGDAEVDAISKSGLSGLTLFLAQRTALEAGDPIGVDISRDELAFYPLIYWPIAPGAQKPSPEALARIDTYMKQGGTVLFDTRDALEATPGNEANSARHDDAARHPARARYSGARAAAARARADQDVLPAEGLLGPLHRRPALGRGDAGRRKTRPSASAAQRAPATASPR